MDARKQTGFASCQRPYCSPWGRVQEYSEIAPGIWSVSTAGHGGLAISAERDAAMPPYLRDGRKYGGPGYYEEDIEWALVALAFPEAFAEKKPWQPMAPFEAAKLTVRQWFPEIWAQYQQAQGKEAA